MEPKTDCPFERLRSLISSGAFVTGEAAHVSYKRPTKLEAWIMRAKFN